MEQVNARIDDFYNIQASLGAFPERYHNLGAGISPPTITTQASSPTVATSGAGAIAAANNAYGTIVSPTKLGARTSSAPSNAQMAGEIALLNAMQPNAPIDPASIAAAQSSAPPLPSGGGGGGSPAPSAGSDPQKSMLTPFNIGLGLLVLVGGYFLLKKK